MKTKKLLLSAAGGLVLAAGAAVAAVSMGLVPSPLDMGRRGPPQKDMTVDAPMRAEVLDTMIKNLDRSYVFPDKAQEIERLLRTRQKAGAYDRVTSAEQLAAVLTEDLRKDTHDGHLDVHYSAAVLPRDSAKENNTETVSPEELADMTRLNFGFEKVQRLQFNIGYIDLHAFAPGALISKRLAAAMTLLADTRALIIDLRLNGGGDPNTVALLASYLFDQRTHLNDIYWREGDRTEQFWTTEQVAGTRYGSQKKVYILTSHDTFSAGEDFTYAMKNLKRATVVGEATGGGAHPGDPVRLNDHFVMFLPNGRSISPITHADWEGVGVTPDIPVAAEKALDTAQVKILKDVLAASTDEENNKRLRHRLSELGA